MKKLLQSLFILLFIASSAIAQNRTITGTVTAQEDGLPLPGVSVKIKGTKSGTVTGADGRYSIRVSSGATSLEFSFIGFLPQTRTIGAGNVINIILVDDSKTLSDVVVTGVGVATQKKLVPIDVATLDAKDFPKSATTNVTQALQGQIAGAQIIQRSGQPGANAQIILRGFTNLSSASPLILIDGVQASSDLLTSIDPNTVDRVEVVKGSAGGMLYGAQGGNGVIQIFTKKGAKNSKLIIDVASRYSNDRIVRLNDLIATNHHWVTDAAGNIVASNGAILAPSAIGVWPNPTALPFGTDKTVQNNKPILLPVYDHIDQGNKVANTFTNSLTIRGGSEKTDYSFGASNLSQQDVYSNNFNRTNLNLNFGFNPVKGLNFRSATQLIYTKEDLLSSNRFNLVNSLQWIDFTFQNPTNGQYVVKPSTLTDGNNPLAEREARSRYSKTPRLVQNFNLNYKFPKFLEFDIKYALDTRRWEQGDFYFNQVGRAQTVFYGSVVEGSILKEYENSAVNYGNASAFFRTDFQNDFKLKVPIKTTTQVTYDARRFKSNYFYAQGVTLPAYPPFTLSSATTRTGGESFEESLIYGFLVNQTVEYGNLFGISAGFRSDYSSVFGGQGTAATFPRGTVFFNPSEFFTNKSFVSNWKLRAAYGEAGVQPGIYDRQVTFSRGNFGESGSTLYTRDVSNNPDLFIQKTKELEIGTDLNLTPLRGNWLSSVVLNGTYWSRKSNDVIQTAPAAPSSGATGVRDNLVSLKSSGFDISMDISAYKSKNLDWNFGFRFGKSKTEVTAVSNNVPITNGVFYLAPGGNLGDLYMQRPLTSIDQLKPNGTRYIPEASAAGYAVASNGYVVNLANYNVVLTGADDLAVAGNVNPDFTSSFINNFTLFKKLSIGVQFDWVQGGDVYNQTRQWMYRDRLHKDFDEPVTIAGQEGSFVAFYNSLYNTNTPLSHFVEDGSYLRLRDLSITYDLTNVLKQKWLRTVSVTATGRNLATWTKYKGLDPEATSALTNQGGTISGMGSFTGVDYYGAPNLKSFQFSLNIGF
jgi:TonB-linked SusC/RagA family outer membrane protein